MYENIRVPFLGILQQTDFTSLHHQYFGSKAFLFSWNFGNLSSDTYLVIWQTYNDTAHHMFCFVKSIFLKENWFHSITELQYIPTWREI